MSYSTKKKQKLSDFDFSKSGAHVALVSTAANGKTAPLIIKSFDGVEKGVIYQGEDLEPSGHMVEMSLEDILQAMYNADPFSACLIANSIVKFAKENRYAGIESLTNMASGAGDSSHSASVRPAPLVAKSNDDTTDSTTNEDETMSDIEKPSELTDVAKAADNAEIVKELAAQAEVIKSMKAELEKFHAAEEQRLEAKFAVMADKYKVLGAAEDSAAMFKSLYKTEQFEQVVKMLDSAVDVLAKQDLLVEKGAAGEGAVKTTMGELESIAKGYMDADPHMTKQQAIVKAAKENPALVG